TFFLFLEELSFSGDISAVTLGEHVLATSLHGLATDYAASNGGLDWHVEHLARNELFETLRHPASVIVGVGFVHDRGECVDRFVVDQQVDAYELGGDVPTRLVIETGVALGAALQRV